MNTELSLFKAEKETEQPRTLATVYADAEKRIAAAGLNQERTARLLRDIMQYKKAAAAIADMLQAVPAAAGKVYDINAQAAIIGGTVEKGWRDRYAKRTGDGWRAYVSERSYGGKFIQIYLDIHGTDREYEAEIPIYTVEESGKRPRVDAEKIADAMKKKIAAYIDEIEKTAVFAERVPALEEKKAAVIRLLEEIREETKNANYRTVELFGLEEKCYSLFHAADI